MGKYLAPKYQIFERNGKSGVLFLQSLTDEPTVIVQPMYDSVSIVDTGKQLPESIIQEYENEEAVYAFGEFNCHYILADGKYGLAFHGKLLAPVQFERIIKLTFCHYLCQKYATWELYHHIGIYFELQATFGMSDELTLSGLLENLVRMNSYRPKNTRNTAALAKRLYNIPNLDDSRYISEYRRYWGIERFPDTGDIHDFVIYTERVILHEDFSITPHDRVYPELEG